MCVLFPVCVCVCARSEMLLLSACSVIITNASNSHSHPQSASPYMKDSMNLLVCHYLRIVWAIQWHITMLRRVQNAQRYTTKYNHPHKTTTETSSTQEVRPSSSATIALVQERREYRKPSVLISIWLLILIYHTWAWKELHTPNCESWSVCADFASWDATKITANIRLELGKVIYEQHRETADLRVVLWKLTSPTNHIQKTSDVRQLHHKSLIDQNVSTCLENMAMKFVKICTNSNRDSHNNRESGAQESET